ncbi:MAG: aldehyde dehydrogenase family protein, partial [Candidatus Micrarchaeaceae archaeon]
MADFKNEFTYKKFVESGREADFDRAFDEAVAKAKRDALGKKHPIYINGKEIFTDAEIIEYSPIDKTVMGMFQKGDRETAKLAVESASSAFDEWRMMSYKERVAIFAEAADLFSRRKFEVSAILSMENGKSRYESVGEVDEAIDFLRYYSADMIKNKGYVR